MRCNYILILAIITGMVFGGMVSAQETEPEQNQSLYDSENWEMGVSSHVIWIGQKLTVNVTGFPGVWIILSMKSSDGNVSFTQETITDGNGSAWFNFTKFQTDEAGRYVLELHVESYQFPILIDAIEINYDDTMYLSLLIEKIELYTGVDFDEYDPITDGTLVEERTNLNTQVSNANIKADKAIQGMFFIFVFFVMIPYPIFIYFFWDDLEEKVREKQEALGMPKGSIKNVFTLQNPTIDQDGTFLMSDHPRFEDGRTKREREKQRERTMKKLKIDPSQVDLIDRDEESAQEKILAYYQKWHPTAVLQRRKDIQEAKEKALEEESDGGSAESESVDEVGEDTELCSECGFEIEKDKDCPFCEVGDEDEICYFCGSTTYNPACPLCQADKIEEE